MSTAVQQLKCYTNAEQLLRMICYKSSYDDNLKSVHVIVS